MAVRDKPSVGAKPPKQMGFDDFELRLGDMMRGERATLGKSLLDVQRDLKIKAAYIAAIENSDPSAFETQGFVAGYVRSYARYLGMDPEQAFEVFCQESGFQTAHGMSAGASAMKSKKAMERAKPVGADPLIASRTPYLPEVASRFSEIDPKAIASLGVLAVIVGGIGWGAWSVLQEIQRVQVAPVAQTPGVVSNVDPLANVLAENPQADYATGETLSTSAALDRLYQPKTLDLPILVERDGPIGAVDPSSVGALAAMESPPQIETAPAIIAEAIRAKENILDEAVAVQVVEKGPAEVYLFAVRPAWVRVQSATGTVLFEKILNAGERYLVPVSEEPALLRAGNSGSVYFEIDGETFGPAGDAATVAKNIPLSADALAESYSIADLESDPALKRIVDLAAAQQAVEPE